MHIAPEVVELEQLAKLANIPINRALKRAGVAPTTYWRWVHQGKEPLTGTIRKVRAAITQLADERAS